MNQINPGKLQHSKWTAANPERKEKHFLVTELLLDDCDNVTDVVLEAVLTCRTSVLPWRNLKDASVWIVGWR